MKTTNYIQLIANILANETISTSFHNAVGTSRVVAGNTSNTAMGAELGREPATFAYNNNTCKWESTIVGFDADYQDETCAELGLFDSASAGNLLDRSTNFSTFDFESNKRYYITTFGELSEDDNTSRILVTDKLIENVYLNMAGSGSDYPTHVAFSTHLILDTFNATTGWTATGGAVATSENKQEGTSSLALTKTGTANAFVELEKTPTAIDASLMETLRIWIRINSQDTLDKLTTSNAVEIRIGNDSSNYKSVTLDKSDLYTIWQLNELSLDDFTETGTVTMSAIDYLYIKFNTNNASDTWTGEEVLLDFMSGVWPLSQTDNTLHQEVVRKAVDTITLDGTTVTYKGLLGTAEGNTYNYFYVGLFDDASAGDMYLVNQLYLTDKNINKQLNFFIELGVRFG